MKFFFRKRPDLINYDQPRICKSCLKEFQGRFCPFCGEKVIEPGERSLLSFFRNLLDAFTFLDSKFLKSLKLLILYPGELSRNIAEGRRVPYMKMISLFFLSSFLYFLFPVFDSYNSSLYTQLNSLGKHSEYAQVKVDKILQAEKISISEFERTYRAQSTNLSKLLLIFLVLAFAGILFFINYSRSHLFFDHLLFSLEFYSYQLLVNAVIIANIFQLFVRLGEKAGANLNFILTDPFFSVVSIASIGYFLVRGQRLFYKQHWGWIGIKTISLIILMQVTVETYRRFLFYISVWTM